MKIASIRRLTADSNHNAFTGACWFQGALYVAFRQGDAHACRQGRILVLRSRDEGVSFDTVAAFRGKNDTRDAHLHATGDQRLFVSGFVAEGEGRYVSGSAWTDNGLDWSSWTPFTGTEGWILWRPEFFGGKHYCAGYDYGEGTSRVGWFESTDGLRWEQRRILCEGTDQPNESYLAFQPEGAAAALVRREHRSRKPLLMRAKPPYVEWTAVELNVPLAGPALWFVDDDIWISGRWLPAPSTAYVGVFRIVGDQPVLEAVLPSGTGGDCSYMGVARHPVNCHRFFLSYYSGHTAPEGGKVEQWNHPDIYLADVGFDAPFIEDWKVTDVMPLPGKVRNLPCPRAGELAWRPIRGHGEGSFEQSFVDATELIKGRTGVVYFMADVDVGPCDSINLFLGYDGPIKVWVNAEEVFDAMGTNPAIKDQSHVRLRVKHGVNRILVALDTNQGKACGIFARYEETQVD